MNIVHLNMCWVTSALGVVCLSTRIRLIKSTCVTIRLCWRYPHRWTYYCSFLIKVATAQATANVKCIALIEFELTRAGWPLLGLELTLHKLGLPWAGYQVALDRTRSDQSSSFQFKGLDWTG